jgi:hypothetical protein
VPRDDSELSTVDDQPRAAATTGEYDSQVGGRLLVHAKIVEAEPPLWVHVVQICLKRDHDFKRGV